MKSKLVTGYLLIALLFGSWSYFLGATRHMSYAYNLGVGLVWPVSMFKSTSELNGASDQAFSRSVQEMQRDYPAQSLKIETAIGMIMMDIYAQQTPELDGDRINALFVPGASIPDDMSSNLWQIRSLVEALKERLDGMDVDELIDEAKDAKESLLALAKERSESKQNAAPTADSGFTG